jgi:death-on-curing protein
MAVFLELNGYSFDAPQMEVVLTIERLATDEESQDSIAQWLQQNSIATA